MLATRTHTKILVDGGDPGETAKVKGLLGFIDGQTTNPSLIARNPDIRKRVVSGHYLSHKEELDTYKNIVERISPLVGDAGVSIEVFSDLDTSAEDMLQQGKEMYSWIPNAYIKYPCTHEGLHAAQMSVREGIRVNLTLCFSQEQAAAVYGATKGTVALAYISPFIGRLDDRGENGVDLIRNIRRMYQGGDGHVQILAASIRSLDHLLAAFAFGADLVTAPAKLLEAWATKGFPIPPKDFIYSGNTPDGRPLIPLGYKSLNLDQPWERFNITHELTTNGILRFVKDYQSTLQAS